MIYLLDTNVISEIVKPLPNQDVVRWLSSIPIYHTAITVITLGEIRKGAEKLINLAKKERLIKWLEIDLISQFSGRIISIDEKIADKWGYLSGKYNSLPAVDGLIAASALVHNLRLVTRNIKDFKDVVELELTNPWDYHDA